MQELQLSLFEKTEEISKTELFSEERKHLINPIENKKPLTSLMFYTSELVVGEDTLNSIKVSGKASLYTEIAFEETGYYPLQDPSNINFAGYLITRDIQGVRVTSIYKSINHYYTLPADEFKEVIYSNSTPEMQLEMITIDKFIDIVKFDIKD